MKEEINNLHLTDNNNLYSLLYNAVLDCVCSDDMGKLSKATVRLYVDDAAEQKTTFTVEYILNEDETVSIERAFRTL